MNVVLYYHNLKNQLSHFSVSIQNGLMTDKAYNEVKVKIGLLFKKYRKQSKLSYRQVEAITGIDHSWVSKFEKGKVNFEIDTLVKLSSGLKIQLKELTDFTHSFLDD